MGRILSSRRHSPAVGRFDFRWIQSIMCTRYQVWANDSTDKSPDEQKFSRVSMVFNITGGYIK